MNVDALLSMIRQPPAKRASTDLPEAARQQTYVMDDGDEYVNPGVQGLVAASEKLLAINRGLAEPDDRDHLQFKRVHGVHDLIRERIVRDAGKVRRQAMVRLAKQRSLKPIHASYFDSYIEGQLAGNPLSSPLEEINPLHLVENSRRMTLMGPGGIGSDSAVTEQAQMVHGSQFGFIDPVAGPESGRSGIDTRFSHGTKIGSNGRVYQRFYDRRKGQYRWMSPQDLDGLVLKLPD